MQGIDTPRVELRTLTDGCSKCRYGAEDNVAILIADDSGTLTDVQVVAVLDHLRKLHERH